jgi:hypothetical protein
VLHNDILLIHVCCVLHYFEGKQNILNIEQAVVVAFQLLNSFIVKVKENRGYKLGMGEATVYRILAGVKGSTVAY